jgi:hypothetical protein
MRVRSINGVSFSTNPKDRSNTLLGYGLVFFTMTDDLGNTLEYSLTAAQAGALGYSLQTAASGLRDSLSANNAEKP